MKENYLPATAILGKRAFAFLIDWYLGSAFSVIPLGIIWNMLTKEETINTDLRLFESPYCWLAGLLGLLFGAIYYYIIPLCCWRGQTVGKKLMKLQIVGEDGTPLQVGRLAIRQIVGVMILEGAFMLTGQYALQMITILTFETVGTVLNYILFAVFIFSAFLVIKRGTAAHDILAHSKVVEISNNINKGGR